MSPSTAKRIDALSHAHALRGARRWTALLPRKGSGSPRSRTTRRNAPRPATQRGGCCDETGVTCTDTICTRLFMDHRSHPGPVNTPIACLHLIHSAHSIIYLRILDFFSITHPPHQLGAEVITTHKIKSAIASTRTRVRVRSLETSAVHVRGAVCVRV